MQTSKNRVGKTKRIGYSVYAGGKNGRHPTQGEKIAAFVDEEQGMRIIQRCLDFYLQHGNKRERLGEMIRRVGMDKFKAAVQQLERIGLGKNVNYVVFIEDDVPKKIVLRAKTNLPAEEAFKFATELSVSGVYSDFGGS